MFASQPHQTGAVWFPTVLKRHPTYEPSVESPDSNMRCIVLSVHFWSCFKAETRNPTIFGVPYLKAYPHGSHVLQILHKPPRQWLRHPGCPDPRIPGLRFEPSALFRLVLLPLSCASSLSSSFNKRSKVLPNSGSMNRKISLMNRTGPDMPSNSFSQS